MINIKDIYWLAGILEGEGCFSQHGKTPLIKLTMTDYDIVQRVKSVMNSTNSINTKYRIGYKPIYTFRLFGSTAVSWMLTLYPLMSNRRKSKIREIVNYWKSVYKNGKVRKLA